MSTQYRLVQSEKTASGGCSAGQGSSEPVAPRIYFWIFTVCPNVSKDFTHKLVAGRVYFFFVKMALFHKQLLLENIAQVNHCIDVLFAGVLVKSWVWKELENGVM
jgi:hypothetical protein